MQYKANPERERKIKLLTIGLISAILVFVVGTILLGAALGSSSQKPDHAKTTSTSVKTQTTTKQTTKTAKTKDNTSTKNTQKITHSKSSKTQSQLLRTGVFSSVKKTSSHPETSADSSATFSPANQYQAQSNLPATGPADHVFTAILIGVATTLFLANLSFTKAKQL